MNKEISVMTVLITGATDGLGKLISRHLAEKDTTLLLHGRNKQKGEILVKELNDIISSDKIRYYNGDFSSLQDVSELANQILTKENLIDILINNVGVGPGSGSRRELSKDGLELRFAVNYLSHVLLTEKLLPLLKPGSNIINIASIGQEPIDFDDILFEQNYEGYSAYARSKAALIMYTFDLAERLRDKDIKVNAIHPASLMNTKMVLETWGRSRTTVEQGAEAVERILFTSTTGAYYDGKHLSKAIPQTYDPRTRAILRERTAEFLKKYHKFQVYAGMGS
jgi:NAD(P)-dependent dehydrogenase (short-subunit alcohol dehydrogenase family)